MVTLIKTPPLILELLFFLPFSPHADSKEKFISEVKDKSVFWSVSFVINGLLSSSEEDYVLIKDQK